MRRQIKLRFVGLTIGMTFLGLAISFAPVMAQNRDGGGAKSASTQSASSGSSVDAMQTMPRLKEKRTFVVTGDENWDEMLGFGKDSGMAEMMTLMMVGGSGMEHMKMNSMKMGGMAAMAMGEAPPPDAQGMPVTVTLKPNPPIVGDNTLDVLVTDASGKPATGLKLSATVAMTSMDMGTETPKVTEGKAGHYAVTANFSMKGPWRVMLTGGKSKNKKESAVSAALDFNVGGKAKWLQPNKKKKK